MNNKSFSAFLFLFLFVGMSVLHAQSKPDYNPKIRELKIKVVTSNMQLTPQQEKQFLPLYTRYSDQLLTHYRAKKALRSNPDKNEVIKKREEIEKDILNIKIRYKHDFLKLISPYQLEKMYEGEAEFKKLLLERLRDKN